MPDTGVTDDLTHLDSSLWESMVRKQVIAQVSSAGKPVAATAGRVIANTTDTRLEIDNGTAYAEALRWAGNNTWTPTLSQGVSTNITKTVTEAKYVIQGNVFECWGLLAVTGTGTAGSPVTVSLPVTPLHGTFVPIGSGHCSDSDTGANSAVVCVWWNGSTGIIFQISSTASAGRWGQAPSLALANGDAIRFNVRCLVA